MQITHIFLLLLLVSGSLYSQPKPQQKGSGNTNANLQPKQKKPLSQGEIFSDGILRDQKIIDLYKKKIDSLNRLKTIGKIDIEKDKRIRALKQKIKNIMKEIERKIEELRVKDIAFQTLEKYTKKLEEKKKELEEKIKELEKEMSEVGDKNDELEKEIEELKKEAKEAAEEARQLTNTLYKRIDELEFTVRAYQKNGMLIKVPRAALELDENNTYEIRTRLLKKIVIKTGSDFNKSQKALKYDLVYYEKGKPDDPILEDVQLGSGEGEREIMVDSNSDFKKFKNGFFQLIVYYEQDGKTETYIKKRFSLALD